MEYHEDSSNEEKEEKPVIETSGLQPLDHAGYNLSPTSNSVSGPKKWSPRSLQDVNRRSAFLPYKQHSTVLTNLQRGNTQAEKPVPQATEVNFHVKAGQGELTRQDIDNEKFINCKDANGFTALNWACYYGQTSTVQMLLGQGADPNVLGPEEESPLHLAASGGHHEIVRMLLSYGADVNQEDHLCNTPLMYAAKGNHPHTCQELLLNGADFLVQNLDDELAHIIAIENNSTLAETVIINFMISKLEQGQMTSVVKTEEKTGTSTHGG